MHSPPWTDLGRVESDVASIKSDLYRKADSHEVHSLQRNVDSLEYTVRELSAEIDRLRAQLDPREMALAILRDCPDLLPTTPGAENG